MPPPIRHVWEHSSFRRSWSMRSAALAGAFWSVTVASSGLFVARMVNGLASPPHAEFPTLALAQAWCQQIDALMVSQRPIATCDAA